MVQCIVVPLEHTGTYYLTDSLQGLFLVMHTVLSRCISFLIPPLSDKYCNALRENGELPRLAKLSILSCDILASIFRLKSSTVVRGHVVRK